MTTFEGFGCGEGLYDVYGVAGFARWLSPESCPANLSNLSPTTAIPHSMCLAASKMESCR